MANSQNAPVKKSRVRLRRDLSGWQAKLVAVVGIVWTSFHILIASGILIIPPYQLRVIHLAFGMLLCFLLAPVSRHSDFRKVEVLDWVIIFATIAVLGYTGVRFLTLIRMAGRFAPLDIYIGIAGIVLLFEAGRRIVSPGLVVLAIIALTYAYFGRSFPEPFTHSGFGFNRLVQHLYLTGEGIFGFILGVSAEIIIVFIIFGSVLQEVGVADFFYELSNSIAGRSRGGPAKVAVISSALMGMVSGETSANVATTGSFTIPLMKRAGYSAHFAGAVECSASAGGQILPPVMGATAFIIADTLGVPYVRLAVAAAIPAILYFTGVLATVHFRAVKKGLTGLDANEIPNLPRILASRGFLLLPLVGIVYFLIRQYTPTFAAFWGGIVVAIAITFFKKETRLDLVKLSRILRRAARTAMSLAVATALVGIIVGVASLTGITLTIADAIFRVTGGAMLPVLFMTMLVALVLGMGLPTTAAYVLTSISAAPVLLRLGFDLIPSHLFVFYFGVLSALTPPVATGAYTAAGLAGANPNTVGFTSLKIALSGFIVPYVFILDQNLILRPGVEFWSLLVPVVTSFLGIVGLSASLEGALTVRMTLISRLALAAGSILLVLPESMTDVAGATLLAGALVYHLLVDSKKLQKDAQTDGRSGERELQDTAT